MIGKMYRPLRITKKNRGYKLHHKYMSNLTGREKGGVREFEQTVELRAVEDANRVQNESIRIEFSEITIPILVDGEKFEPTSTKQVVEKKSPFIVVDKKRAGILGRKFERPGITIELEGQHSHPFGDLKESEWLFSDGVETNEEFVGNLEKGKWVLKPEMSSRGEELFFEMPIYPTPNNEATDWLKVEMKPVIFQGEEYMEIKTNSLTQVIIVSNTKIVCRP